MIANSRGLYHELDHRHLVDECRCVFNARGDLFRRLVQAARQLDVSRIFVQRGGGSGALRVRADTITSTHCRTIQRGPALDAVSRLDARVGSSM